MQPLDIQRTSSFLKYLGNSKATSSKNRMELGKDADNPYMLDAINEIGGVLTVYGGDYGLSEFERLTEVVQSDPKKRFNHLKSGFSSFYPWGEDKGKMRMVRISECKYLVATVYESSILIRKSGVFFHDEHFDLEKLDSKIREEAKFTVPEGRYSYLEWPHLNRAYSEKPFFLTLDDKGNLRLHYVNEKTKQVIRAGEVFRCATFSLGGKYIYAINEKQELCKIDLQESKIAMKRKIEGLSNPEEVLSSHIKQLAPWIFAIGSVRKVDNEEKSGTNLKPSLHLVSGDVSDLGEDLKIKAFEMPLFEAFDSKKPVMFRTMYLKRRQLLLFGHSGSNKVRVLNLTLDGNEEEIEEITLKNTLRGMICMKEETPDKMRPQYQDKELELSKGPQLMILDSEGEIHHFRYFDPKSCAPTLSLFVRPRFIKQFVKNRGRVREWLDRKEKKKENRCKSRDSKIGITSTAQKKKRSKSQNPRNYLPLETKISSNFLSVKNFFICRNSEKQETITKLSKESHHNISFGLFKSPKSPLFKAAESPFLSAKKTEDKPAPSGLFSMKTEENKTTTTNNLFSSKVQGKTTASDLFSAKTEDKPTTSSLFSVVSSSTKTTGNSLFGFSSKSDFSSNKSESKPQNSLLGPAPVSTNKVQPRSEANDLFSLKSQNRTLQTLPDDPIKKKTMLFLNKFESDVTFKVEDQEFPAHKSILSEKCRFFKNMFSSGMSESHASVIEISDTKASMFKGFLQYVYLGKATLNEELAMGLFEFSEKYMIDELKESCENCLAYWITVKSCSKIYETACFYEADSLKAKTLLFFESHLKEIIESKDFEDFPKSTYIVLKRIQWNDKMIFDPYFAQFMNSYRHLSSESSGSKTFLK